MRLRHQMPALSGRERPRHGVGAFAALREVRSDTWGLPTIAAPGRFSLLSPSSCADPSEACWPSCLSLDPGAGERTPLRRAPTFSTSPRATSFATICGLAADGGPALLAQLQVYGDDVRFALLQRANSQCLAVELVGQYQYDTQNFFADGTASHPLLSANGNLCQVDFAQFHLDGATVNPTSFSGVMRISYLGSSPVTCNCQFWFTVQASLCTPPACPSVPTQCS